MFLSRLEKEILPDTARWDKWVYHKAIFLLKNERPYKMFKVAADKTIVIKEADKGVPQW